MIYRLPIGEELLAEKVLGIDELNRRVVARVETCNCVYSVPTPRMLCYQKDNQQVVKECRYGVYARPVYIPYCRVVILRGQGIEHTTRGDWKRHDLGQPFRPEDLEAFTSPKEAMAYAQSWVRSNIVLSQSTMAEVVL